MRGLGSSGRIRAHRSTAGGGDGPPAYTPPSIGAVLADRYVVRKHVGRGGMGLVVLAFDRELERDVAIKLVGPDVAAKPGAFARFREEARAMAGVRHENVANVFAFGEHGGVPFLVMEYVPGRTVVDLIFEATERGHLAEVDEVIGILEQVCRGLSAIHRAGIIHGDIKPGNILVGPAFRAVVTDFGLMRWLGQLEDYAVITGTPAYIPPEVVFADDANLRLTPAADVYALGITAFEMFTGRLPYPIETVEQLFEVHLARGPVPRIGDLRTDLHPAFDEVFARVLSPSLEGRYPTADAFRRALLDARSAAALGARSLRIVVADDDEDFRDLAAAALASAYPGSEIDCVEDGKAALASIDARPADLAVIDLRMPGLNGMELTAALRATSRNERMPIVVVTAHGGAPDWKVLQSLGASGFLVKPLDPHALVALARRLVRGG